jgi:integrating conjugative element protein (TIGR03761 family)
MPDLHEIHSEVPVDATPRGGTPARSSELPATTSPAHNDQEREVPDPGHLTDAVPDRMTLHTREAWQLFTGRRADPARRTTPIPGGRRFASVMKMLWLLSANDNPYADWILQRVYERLARVRRRLDRSIRVREAEMQGLVERGLSLAVMASREPMHVEIGFGSPYGYAAAEAILEFDRFVRVVRTLMHKDRLGENEGRAAIREIGREFRALFVEPIRWERYLVTGDLRALSRRDYLPGADDAACERVRAAARLFGAVPRDIFIGDVQPRHTRRRIRLTEAERRLLRDVDLGAVAASAAGGASA